MATELAAGAKSCTRAENSSDYLVAIMRDMKMHRRYFWLCLLLLSVMNSPAKNSGDKMQQEIRARFMGVGVDLILVIDDPQIIQQLITWIKKEGITTPDPRTLGSVLPFVQLEALKKRSTRWHVFQKIDVYANLDSSGKMQTTAEQREALLKLLHIDQFEYLIKMEPK
jgi:hypothetical protein